jgi:hypothetical protein
MTATSQRTQLQKIEWEVKRTATIDEVIMDNGGIRYNVQIMDEGRKPFLSRWFADPVGASDFADTVRIGIPSGRAQRHG